MKPDSVSTLPLSVGVIAVAAIAVLASSASARPRDQTASIQDYLSSMAWPVRASLLRAEAVAERIDDWIVHGDPPFLGGIAAGCTSLRAVESRGRLLQIVAPARLKGAHARLVRAYTAVRLGCARARITALAAKAEIQRAPPANATDRRQASDHVAAARRQLSGFARGALAAFIREIVRWRSSVVVELGAGDTTPPLWLIQLSPHAQPPGTPRIAFVRWDWATTRAHIFEMNPDGSGLRQLTYGNSLDTQPRWSPDGRRIVFTRRTRADGNAFRSDIVVIHPEGGGLRRLTFTGSASAPAWSPDGHEVAYVQPDGLFLMNGEGGEARQLSAERQPISRGNPTLPSWSPDGGSIAFGTAGGIAVVDRSTGTERWLARRVGGRHDPTCPNWSPDGRRIAFDDTVSFGDIGHEVGPSIFVADLGSGSVQKITTHADTGGFAWSPDSARIVYHHARLGGIRSVNAAGTDERSLSRDTIAEGLPVSGFAWSRTGRILYTSDGTGRGDLYTVDAAGSGRQQLTWGPASDGAPTWSGSQNSGSC